MKINIYKLLLIMLFTSIVACRTEDSLMNTNDVVQTQEYTNKSLWKEDEVFIKNIKKVYDKNADETRIQSRYGKIFWDYATSMNTFDESYLIAPIIKEAKVISYVEVKKMGNKVFFNFIENDDEVNDFFNTLIFTKKEDLSLAESPSNYSANDISNSIESTRVLECKTVTTTLIVGYVEGGGPDQGDPIESTKTRTICKFVDGPALEDVCIGEYDAQGNCTGTGSGDGGGGYNYNPEQEELEDNCEEAKNTINDLDFKAKFDELNTLGNLLLDHEVGFYKKNGHFFPISSESCDYVLKSTGTLECTTGLMHVHPNKNCEGDFIERTPSWGDVLVFMQFAVQAQNCTGSASNAYHTVITAGGSYMLKYNKDIVATTNTYNFDKGNDWFKDKLDELMENDQYTQENIENAFLELLNTYSSIDGLEVYKLENGNASKLSYDAATKTSTLIQCP